MENSVQRLKQDLIDMRNQVVSIFGQPYVIPSDNGILVDIVDVMDAWAGHEADLTIIRPDYYLIEELENKIYEIKSKLNRLDADADRKDLELKLKLLKAELEKAENTDIIDQAYSSEDFIQHLDNTYGLEQTSQLITYHNKGNINHHYYERHYDCDNGYHYVVVSIHKYGDIYRNYTDEIILRFSNEEESNKIMWQNISRSVSVDVNGEEYQITVDGRYEDIEVIKDGTLQFTLHNVNATLKEVRKSIAEKLGIQLVD